MASVEPRGYFTNYVTGERLTLEQLAQRTVGRSSRFGWLFIFDDRRRGHELWIPFTSPKDGSSTRAWLRRERAREHLEKIAPDEAWVRKLNPGQAELTARAAAALLEVGVVSVEVSDRCRYYIGRGRIE